MRWGAKWLARLIVALDVLVTCLIVLVEPTSIIHRVAIEGAGTLGHIGVWALLGIGVLALGDVVVNDVLPERYVFPTCRRYRHTIYMMIALACLSMVFAIVKSVGDSAVVARYLLTAFGASMIAVLDVYDRVEREGQ